MPSLVQLPPEILAQIYTELLTNDKKELWPQLRESNRSCFEAAEATLRYHPVNSWIHRPNTRSCVGEIDDSLHNHNASDPEDDTTDEDEDDNPSQHEHASQRPDPSDDADDDSASLDSITTCFPDEFRPSPLPRPTPPPPKPPSPPRPQHRQCTNRYFLHPAILATTSHIHAAAAAVLYGANTFHFALVAFDFDNDDGGLEAGLSSQPWSRHLDKIRDVRLTRNCAIPGRERRQPRPRPMRWRGRRNGMGGDAYPDRDHWGDRAFREDLCGVINGLWFFRSLATRFQRLRLDLGGLVRCRNENAAPSTAVLFDQLTKAFASLDVVQLLDIRVTARAMQLERWKIFARNVAKSMKGRLQIIEGGLEDDGASVGEYKFCNIQFVIGPHAMDERDEVTGL